MFDPLPSAPALESATDCRTTVGWPNTSVKANWSMEVHLVAVLAVESNEALNQLPANASGMRFPGDQDDHRLRLHRSVLLEINWDETAQDSAGADRGEPARRAQ